VKRNFSGRKICNHHYSSDLKQCPRNYYKRKREYNSKEETARSRFFAEEISEPVDSTDRNYLPITDPVVFRNGRKRRKIITSKRTLRKRPVVYELFDPCEDVEAYYEEELQPYVDLKQGRKNISNLLRASKMISGEYLPPSFKKSWS